MRNQIPSRFLNLGLALVAVVSAGCALTGSNQEPSPDSTPPVISNVMAAGVSTNVATISWATDEASDSQVEYGTSTAYGGSSSLSTAMVTSHSLVLNGLQAGTLYHYRVKSRDAAGNLAVSGDFTFTTAQAADTTPPVISGVAANNVTASGATITWTTNELADSQVEYGTSTAYGSSTALDTFLVNAHAALLSGLHAGTTYHYRVKSRDAAGNLAVSGNFTFTTAQATDATPPVISGVAANNITTSGATIIWTTDEASDSQVDYGTSTAYGASSPLNATRVTSHSVVLGSLAADTLYHYRVRSRDASGNAAVSSDFTFRTSAPPPISITTASLPSGVVGTSYNATLAASGGTGSYLWSLAAGQLPNGLNLSSSGAISGTPVAAGTFNFTVGVRDSSGAVASRSLSISISAPPIPPSGGSTVPNLKVALFGDQGLNSNSRAVLQLVKNEGAHFVIHLGDFDYGDNPDAWDQQINDVLGSSYPYFAAAGNHDTAAWSGYQAKLLARLARIPDATCLGNVGVQAACRYKGLFFLLLAPGVLGSGHDTYLRDQLAADTSIWSVAAWHKNMRAMQVGGKSDETGWGVYEEGRKGGAIIATSHEHSYQRTRTLTSTQNQTVDPEWPGHDMLRVAPGSTFVFVSGLGGNSIRNQDRCLPTSFPYGCNGEWASIYTSDQGAKYGALFIEFHVDGDPAKARGYFKNIAGEIVDSFTIFATLAAPPAPPPTDTVPPVLSAITSSSVTQSSALIAWTTNEPADSQVEYGETTAYGQTTVVASALVTSHSAALSGLNPDTLYHYRVRSRDAAGNLAVSSDFTFRTATPAAPPPLVSGIWIGSAEIAQLPTSGAAWSSVKARADSSCGTPDLANQDDSTNVCILAKALVFARIGQEAYRSDVVTALRSIVNMGTYNGRALALGRELAAYVISADLISLKTHDPTLDQQFRAKLVELRTTPTSGGPGSLVECHENRPNNWGTHCGGSRAAVAAYLGDTAELARVAQVFKGWLGDRTSYAGFSYGDLSWQCDPSRPVGINPLGCTKNGHPIDGVLPDDQRRGGGFTWPPPKENYVYEALQGALVQAVILKRAGYDPFNWENRALLRAFQWLHTQANFPAEGDDTWEPHIINFFYGASFPAPVPSSPGKNVGWTDWTHR